MSIKIYVDWSSAGKREAFWWEWQIGQPTEQALWNQLNWPAIQRFCMNVHQKDADGFVKTAIEQHDPSGVHRQEQNP
jgi:hypothetical protein